MLCDRAQNLIFEMLDLSIEFVHLFHPSDRGVKKLL